MKKQCKVITFPMNHGNILDTKGNLERRGKFLIEAIRQIAGNEAVKSLTPLIIAYRVACDLNALLKVAEYIKHGDWAKAEDREKAIYILSKGYKAAAEKYGVKRLRGQRAQSPAQSRFV